VFFGHPPFFFFCSNLIFF